MRSLVIVLCLSVVIVLAQPKGQQQQQQKCAKPAVCTAATATTAAGADMLPLMTEGCPSCIAAEGAESQDRVMGGRNQQKCANLESIPACTASQMPTKDAKTNCPSCKPAAGPAAGAGAGAGAGGMPGGAGGMPEGMSGMPVGLSGMSGGHGQGGQGGQGQGGQGQGGQGQGGQQGGLGPQAGMSGAAGGAGRRPDACTPEQMEALPECEADARSQVMSFEFKTGGCPVCKRAPMPVCTATEIKDCAASEKPTFDKTTGCLSCKVANPFEGCKKEQFEACAIDQLPECDEAVQPTLKDCCPTCIRAAPERLQDIANGVIPVEAAADREAAAARIKAQKRPNCEAVTCPEYSTLPECSAEQKRTPFTVPTDAAVEAAAAPVAPTDAERCCRKCRVAAKVEKAPKRNLHNCTKDAMDACLATVADCAEGEAPKAIADSCCKTCKRVQRKCTPEQVASCAADAPVCAEGVKPEPLAASPCCQSCRPAPPTCEPACADGEVCVPTRQPKQKKTDAAATTTTTTVVAATVTTGKCVATKSQEVVVPVLTTVAQENVKELVTKPASAQALVQEAVRRFCDRADTNKSCTKGFHMVMGNATVAVGVDKEKNGRIRINIPHAADMEGMPEADKMKDHMKTIIDALHDNSSVPHANIHVNRTKCAISLEDTPKCAAGETPKMNFTTFCHSCRPVGPYEGCATETIQACPAHDTLAECAEGVKPAVVNCCQTCKKTKPAAAAKNGKPATVPACETICDLAAVPECAEDAKPKFDEAACCPSCKIVRPVVEKPLETCTPEEMKSCLEAAPVCAEAEKPQKIEGSCCQSCKRPQRLCSKEQVANCSAAAPACATDEKPTFAENNCCPSCIPARPVCTPACATGQVCGKDSTCVAGKRLNFNITADAAVADHVTNMKPREMQQLIGEMIKRSCDKAANETRCKAVPEHVDKIVNVTRINKKGPRQLHVVVDVPADLVPLIDAVKHDKEATDVTTVETNVVTAALTGTEPVAADETPASTSASAGTPVAAIVAVVAAVAVVAVIAVVIVRRRQAAAAQATLNRVANA